MQSMADQAGCSQTVPSDILVFEPFLHELLLEGDIEEVRERKMRSQGPEEVAPVCFSHHSDA